VDMWVDTRAGRLRARIDLPRDSTSVLAGVALVHGSGPATRDAPYWAELAPQLTACGIACLRYDKPGCGESEGDWRHQTFEDRAHESLAALDALARELPGTPCAGLAGVSQGGWIVMLAAARSKRVRFAISYSSAGVAPAEQELYRLAHHLPAEGHSPAETAEAVDLLKSRLARNRGGMLPEAIFEAEAPSHSKPWYRLVSGTDLERLRFDLANYNYDPWPALVETGCPVLAIWGDRDLFTPVERSLKIFRDAARVAGRSADEFMVVRGVGHDLRGGDGRIAPVVAEKTAGWLQAVCVAQAP
jgi:pimeloyl-ACP methyl ester carboxylesterase